MAKLSFALVLVAVGYVSAQASMYGQCGGNGYSGPTTCVAGATCTYSNPYYSQCLPGSPSSSSSTKTTSTSSTVTTTSSSATSTATGTSYTILAGGYTSFIATYKFTPSTGTLQYISQSNSNANPSWIAQHQTLKNVLYATNENSNGAVESFTINSDGSVTSVATQSSGGSDPANLLPLSTGQVAIMNYDGGNGAIIPTDSTGLHFSTTGESTFTFTGNPSHPHEAYEYNGEVFVPDLGADMVWRLRPNSAGIYSVVGSLAQPSGSGPRHMQIYGGTLFVLHELASTLTAEPLPAADSAVSTSAITSSVSVVPPNPPSGAAWAAAELLLPPPNSQFPTPYLYASNRNTGTLDSRGDAITILQYSNATQALNVVGYAFTGLDQIRGMQIGGPNNEYLIAGSYAGSSGVAVFQRTNGGANLTLIARDTTIGTRTSFVWV